MDIRKLNPVLPLKNTVMLAEDVQLPVFRALFHDSVSASPEDDGWH
jgi:hypothetical protein